MNKYINKESHSIGCGFYYIKILLVTIISNHIMISVWREVENLLRVRKVQIVEAFTASELQDEINGYIERNRNENIIDIKINIYEAVVPEEFWDGSETSVPTQDRHSALLLIGE